MDFRIKKLILEEGMKTIAETEGVKLEMNFDDYHMTVEVTFKDPARPYYLYDSKICKRCSYDMIRDESVDVFKTIEETRREVQNMKNPGRNSIDITMPPRHGKSMLLNEMLKSGGINPRYGYFGKSSKIPKIKNVIFNYPATIVFWADGDKTVVKCQNGDMFDAEKGLAMAIVKKMNGGKGNHCEIFKPWIEKYEKISIEEFVAMLMKESVVFHKAACETLADDIQDILEGKVDPMMIKVDGEPKLDKGEAKGCSTCKYECKDCMDEPCHACILASSSENVSPNWEPKE